MPVSADTSARVISRSRRRARSRGPTPSRSMPASLPERQRGLPDVHVRSHRRHRRWSEMEIKDVVVIGGGAAGLNAALMLARSRRSVLVVDGGAPRNAAAAGVHGLLGREGVPPAELLRRGADEVRGYGGELTTGVVVKVSRADGGLAAELADGRSVRGRRVLV